MPNLTVLHVNFRLSLIRAQLEKAYDEGDAALIERLSERIDLYQRFLWNLQEQIETSV